MLTDIRYYLLLNSTVLKSLSKNMNSIRVRVFIYIYIDMLMQFYFWLKSYNVLEFSSR